MPLVDAIKASGCLLIVLHHLAFYGPMSDVAYPRIPGLIDWLYHYGRMAVMGFFVVTGFLTAAAFAPNGISVLASPWPAIGKRYLRLAFPLLAALALAMIIYAVVRPWLPHESVSGATTWPQLLAHLFLSNELLNQEALSAGVWYVGVDFQLFVIVALVLWAAGMASRRWPSMRKLAPVAVAILTVASLLIFNCDDAWDETALYFFAYYGLGCLAWWVTGRPGGWMRLGLVAAVVMLTLAIDFRERVVVALVVMLVLGAARQSGWLLAMSMPRPILYLARISFSVFLVHFPLSLLVSATVSHYFGQQLFANLLGMVASLILSIAGGALFYRWVESRTDRAPVRAGILAAYALVGAATMAG